jgi:ATP-dependent helicase HepA
MRRGRDRLLELNSFDAKTAARVIERVHEAEADPSLRQFLFALLDHFGVRLKEHEGGDVVFDPSHAYIEAFPSIPAEGMLATFDRKRALSREDMSFVTADHPLVRDAIDLLLDSPAGTTAFGVLPSRTPNLFLEAVFVLETVADTRWHVDAFLAPTPIRVVVDVKGNDLTATRDVAALAGYVEDADLHRFLERPGFTAALLRDLLDRATTRAEARAGELKTAAVASANDALATELQRLRDLQKLNDHVRAEEITAAEERLEQTQAALQQARVRLDSLRLVLEGGERV